MKYSQIPALKYLNLITFVCIDILIYNYCESEMKGKRVVYLMPLKCWKLFQFAYVLFSSDVQENRGNGLLLDCPTPAI